MATVNTSIGPFNSVSPAAPPDRARSDALERSSGLSSSRQSSVPPQPAPSRPSAVVNISEQARQALEAERVQAARVQATERRDVVQRPEESLNRERPV